MQSIMFMSLLPLLVSFSFVQDFDPLAFFNLAWSSQFHVQSFISLLKLSLLMKSSSQFHIFVHISPPLSSISIKGMLIGTKVWATRDVECWHLNFVFLMDTTICARMTPLESYHLEDRVEIPHDHRVGSSISWYQRIVVPLPLCHSLGHPMDYLDLLLVREVFSSLDDHLKLRITCTLVGYHL